MSSIYLCVMALEVAVHYLWIIALILFHYPLKVATPFAPFTAIFPFTQLYIDVQDSWTSQILEQ